MRQLTCTGPGRLEWTNVETPTLADDTAALIRPLAVARCEIDPLLIFAGPMRSNSFAVGHEAVAEVLEVGGSVRGVRPGQLVAASFQLCCGSCAPCLAGLTASCEKYPVLSDYGMEPLAGIEYGGMLSDVVAVPHADAMLHPLPAGLSPVDFASVGDNVSDGYRAVAPHLGRRPHAPVLIVCHGNRSIALYATQIALALGSAEVTVASDDQALVAQAEQVGAKAVLTDFGRRAGRWPVVVDCGARLEGLHFALSCTEPGGILQSVSYYPEPSSAMPLGRLYTLGIEFHIGRVNSAATVPAVLRLAERGLIEPRAITSCVIGWDDAPRRYLDEAIKLVVAR